MPPTPPYVELHAHSSYSILDGASTPEELIGGRAELGHSALALTDHDSLAGAMEFAMAAADSAVRAPRCARSSAQRSPSSSGHR